MKQQIYEESVKDMLKVFKDIVEVIDDIDVISDKQKLTSIKRWANNTVYNIKQRIK